MYFRIIWSFLMAISYLSTFFLFLSVAILLKKIKFNISMITTAFIYIFIFLQPNIIQFLISLVSFRILSNIAWIQGNVAYQYNTASHLYWLISFCLPILITFSLLIPFYMFYCIKQHYFISTSVQPYMTGELNRFDTQSTTVCAVSIILGSSIYTAQNQNFIEIVYPFYIIIALINGWFLIKMIINILLAYFDKLHEQIDKVKEIISQKFPDYLIEHPQAEKLLESKKKKQKEYKLDLRRLSNILFPKLKKF